MKNNQENEDFNLEVESELPFPADVGWDLRDDDNEYHICEPDNWADGDALASVGWGTDEDYGYFGECETYE